MVKNGFEKMIFVVMVAAQLPMTGLFVVVINRKLPLQNIALRNQLGVYLLTIDKNKIKPQIRDRDRRLLTANTANTLLTVPPTWS